MVAAERFPRPSLVLCAALAFACTAPTVPPKTAPAAAKGSATAAETKPDEEPPAPGPVRDSTVVVIDSGEPDLGRQPSLIEASKREKARKAGAGKPVAVITNESLPKLAKGGQLTYADLSKTKGEVAPAAPAETAGDQQERFWRDRGLDIRHRWRSAVDESAELERQAAELRRRFYEEADPFRRDGEIKPEWDRTLDRVRLAKERALAAEKELGEFMEQGRQAGALPGWLREGAELEPKPAIPPPATLEAIEPPILHQEPHP
ncbi:MAG TPA: hypothetical protein VN783_06920 [Thermoanaerobaculia bacterium]|nr:hypothetical protein [Thermoanaerobaculia bacterium]